MKFVSLSQHWQPLTAPEPYGQAFVCPQPTPPGWHLIQVKPVNRAARQWLATGEPILLSQDQNLDTIELYPSGRQLELVFYRHDPLTQLTLQWLSTQRNANARFRLRIRRVTTVRAWLHMLHQVSQYHRRHGISWQHIYRITRARAKRAGKAEALRKLVRAYHPLLVRQLTSSNPYRDWQDSLEPQPPAEPASDPHSTAPMVGFILRRGSTTAVDQTLKSLRALRSAHWRAWVDAASLSAEALEDTRIRPLSHTALPSALTPNIAPTMVPTWWWFLEPGDSLPTNALNWVQSAITRHPQWRLVYGDQDTLNARQERVAPAFKPDWNPDLWHSYDYLGQATLVHHQVLTALPDSTDWSTAPPPEQRLAAVDQVLRAYGDRAIGHVPQILYHRDYRNPWLDRSTAALNHWLQARGQTAVQLERHQAYAGQGLLVDAPASFHRLHYPLPEPAPRVSVIIPTRDALELVRACVDSVLQHTRYPDVEILLIDNQSREPETLAWFQHLAAHPQVTVLPYDQPFNYPAINNFGVAHATGSVVCMLNNDTRVMHADWLQEMVSQAVRPDIGCVGARLFYPDDTVQHGGVITGLFGIAGHAHKYLRAAASGYMNRLQVVQNFSAVTAACLVVEKAIYEHVGGLNEAALPVAFNDVDFCLRVQEAGWRNLWTPFANLYHDESKTRGPDITPEKAARAQREAAYIRQTWSAQLAHDPAYNPNLTRVREDFGVRLESLADDQT